MGWRPGCSESAGGSFGGSIDLFGVDRFDESEACEVAGVEGKDALDAVDLH